MRHPLDHGVRRDDQALVSAHCHHRRIVADYLLVGGHKVFHLMDGGKIDEARLTEGAQVHKDGTVTCQEWKTYAGSGPTTQYGDAPAFPLRGETSYQLSADGKLVNNGAVAIRGGTATVANTARIFRFPTAISGG